MYERWVYIQGAFPTDERLVDRLTARQQEVLAVAVERGYYDDPRGATHADIADELGLAPATVGER